MKSYTNILQNSKNKPLVYINCHGLQGQIKWGVNIQPLFLRRYAIVVILIDFVSCSNYPKF